MKSLIKFKVFLEFDPEYEGFVADVPSLPGCMSQGKTESEALKNIKDAIDGYLAVIKKHRKNIPSKKVHYVTAGVCLLRKDNRTFRISRINNITID